MTASELSRWTLWRLQYVHDPPDVRLEMSITDAERALDTPPDAAQLAIEEMHLLPLPNLTWDSTTRVTDSAEQD